MHHCPASQGPCSAPDPVCFVCGFSCFIRATVALTGSTAPVLCTSLQPRSCANADSEIGAHMLFTVTYLFCLLCLLLSHMPGFATEIAPGAGDMAQLSKHTLPEDPSVLPAPISAGCNHLRLPPGVLHLWAPQSPALLCTQHSQKHIM